MPEILKRGKQPGDNLIGCWRCAACGCLFRLSRTDAGSFRREDDDGPRGEGGRYVKGACPDCRQHLRLHASADCPPVRHAIAEQVNAPHRGPYDESETCQPYGTCRQDR